MHVLAKWLHNFLLGYVGDIVGWVEGKLQARREVEAAEKHGEAVGAANAVTEVLEGQIAATYQDTHAPTVDEMNSLFAKREGGKK